MTNSAVGRLSIASRTSFPAGFLFVRTAIAVLCVLQALPFSDALAAEAVDKAPKVYRFEFVPAKSEDSLKRYLKFIENNAEGSSSLRAQYLVADLLIQNGKYLEASRILENLAAVALTDEFFNVSVLQKLADCHMHLGRFQQASQAYSTVGNRSVKALVPESILGMATSALALGNRDQAYLRFQELVAFHPTYQTEKRYMLPLGLIQWENEKYAGALEYFMKDQKNPACQYFAGLCLRKLNKPMEALGMFKTVLRDHPRTVWAQRARFELGETFYQQKDYVLAARTFQEVETKSEKDLWEKLALYRLAATDIHVKRYKPAEERLWPLQKREKDHPLYPNVVFLLTESLAEQKKLDEVVSLLKQEMRDKKTPDSTFRLIWSLTAIGKYEEAIQLSNDFLRNQWDLELTPKTLLVKGYALNKLERYPESVASYQLVTDNFTQTLYAPRALHMMAITYYRSQQYAAVASQINHQWNALDPALRRDYPDTLFWIAESHLRLENGQQARAFYQQFIDAAPADHPLISQALLGQAVSYAVDKDFPTAVLTLQRTYQTAQEKDDKPFMAGIMLEMANVYFNSKDYENAAASYRSFQQIDPKHEKIPFSLYQEGMALHRAEYYSDAIAAWEKLVKNHPKDPKAPDALLRVAKTRFDLGEYTAAVKNYHQLVSAYPKSGHVRDARLQIGQSYYNAGDFEKAIVAYTDFLNRFPDDPQAPSVLQLLQTCYYQAKKTPEEIEKLTKDQPKTAILADIYWEEGAKNYNEKNYDKAREYFQKILFEFPTSSLAPQAGFYRGEALYLQENFAEAIPAYENYLQFFPEDGQRSLAMFHLAVSLFNQKDYAKSAKAFQDFAREFPDDPMAKNATLNVALCYAKAADLENAVAAYQDYIRLYPDAEDVGAAYLQIGQLYEKFGQDAKAAEAYRAVPGGLTERPEAIFSAGRVYRKLNQVDQEAQMYQVLQGMSAKSDPFRIAGLLQLAEIYLERADFAAAAAVYRDVAQNAQDDQSLTLAQERLKALEASGQ
jgi:TolA-binding protein